MQKIFVAGHAGMGWTARIPLGEGIASTYRWFLEQGEGVRA